MLRPEFVERKLQQITDDLARLAPFRDETYESLIGDEVRLAAVERMLERIVLRAVDINEHVISELASGDERDQSRLSYRDTFLALADFGVYERDFAEHIAPSAGLRNILVHAYNDLDHRIVHAAIPQTLDQFSEYVTRVRRFVWTR